MRTSDNEVRPGDDRLTPEQLDAVVAGYDSPPPGYVLNDYTTKGGHAILKTPTGHELVFSSAERALAFAWNQYNTPPRLNL